MNVFKGIEAIKAKLPHPVLTIGNFDGVHIGHQAVLKHVVERARDLSTPGMAMTFDPHPVKHLSCEGKNQEMTGGILIDPDGSLVDRYSVPLPAPERHGPRREQDPELWWECIREGTREILGETGIPNTAVRGIGIAYQMHGLVPLNSEGTLVRPSIIWCDSRAVSTGVYFYRLIADGRIIDTRKMMLIK